MADHSLIPLILHFSRWRSSQISHPGGRCALWMSKSPPTCALRSLIPVGCLAPLPPPPHILGQTIDRCITISQHLEFKGKIQNNPNKQITTTTERCVPWSDLNFPKVCSKILLDSSTLRRFLWASRSYMLHIPNSADGNYLKEKENHTLCLKSDIKPKKLRFTKM